MVQITDLPEEIFVMIVRKLDFWSLNNMYNSCKTFRNVLCLHGVVIECNMSMNLMATVKTLKLSFFKAISNHLTELNMCGVPDLTKTKTLPAFKKLKRLKVLDISYTNLNISDLMAIHGLCPSLKDVTVNFVFGQAGYVPLGDEILLKYQTLFEHFENVHLVGSLNNLLCSKLVLNILKKTKLDTLKFSAVEVDNVHDTVAKPCSNYEIPHFRHLAVYLINWRSTRTYEYLSNFLVISMIDLKNYEFFIICSLSVHVVSVYATQIFKKFFSEHFNIDAECVTDYKRNLIGNVAFMIWNRETTQFNDIFYKKLYRRVKPYFRFTYEASSDVSCPQNYNWIYTEPRPDVKTVEDDDEYRFRVKRRKSQIPELVLHYDNLLKDKVKAQLSIVFKSAIIPAVLLPTNADYFRKITFLSLSGGAVIYDPQFFSILFGSFHNLITFTVECPTASSCRYYTKICHSVQASKSLKNIRLLDKGMDFNNIFDPLSQCKTLENIHLVDQRLWDHSKIGDPCTLINNCANLCSVFIEAPFAEAAQTKQLQWFNKLKTVCRRPHLRVVINRVTINNTFNYNYDPFMEVFQLNPIKPT